MNSNTSFVHFYESLAPAAFKTFDDYDPDSPDALLSTADEAGVHGYSPNSLRLALSLDDLNNMIEQQASGESDHSQGPHTGSHATTQSSAIASEPIAEAANTNEYASLAKLRAQVSTPLN